MTDRSTLLELAERPRWSDFPDCPCREHRMQRISDLVEPALIDLEFACALIGSDTYGKPIWTPETIDPHNRVVQLFARHRIALRALANQPEDKSQ